MRHLTAEYNSHPNLRAKLNNSLADLNWYAYRWLVVHKFSPPDHKKALAFLDNLTQELPAELERIREWKHKIENCPPRDAETVFAECRTFCTNFDNQLKEYGTV